MRRAGAGEGPQTLLQTLDDLMSVRELKQLAGLWLRQPPARKADLVNAVIARLEGDGLREVYGLLDELQKTAVAEVVHSPDHHLDLARFEARHGGVLARPSFGEWKERPSHLDLFFYGSWSMPSDLKERLQLFVPAPPAVGLETVEAPPVSFAIPRSRWNPETRKSSSFVEQVPVQVREMERPALHDLHAVLRLVDSGKVAVTDKTRRPTAAACGAIARVLMGGDFYGDGPAGEDTDSAGSPTIGPIRAFAWPLLLQAGKLARPSGSRLQLTPAGKKALAEPPAEVIRNLWRDWVATDLVDELSRIESVRGQTGNGKRGLTDPSERRDAIAQALAECPPERWVGVDEFFRYMLAADHSFVVSLAPWNLYFGELQYGSLGGLSSDSWTILEERYALCVLFEYLATLGFVDLAFVPPDGVRDDYGDFWGTDEFWWLSRYDGLLCLRLTRLGAFCLKVSETGSYRMAPLAARSCLRVLDNRDIVVTGEGLLPADRLLLETFAARSSDVVWKLTPESLLAAVEGGHRIEELREFLLARSGELPRGIEMFLAETTTRCARLRDLGTARLIECSDEHVAALIANDARARRHCLLAGERHLVVRPSAEKAFRRVLREMGYALPPVNPTVSRRSPADGETTSG